MQQRFQRRNQQGERRAQFMADIGEETAFQAVEIN
jgi:hypothetical protein